MRQQNSNTYSESDIAHEVHTSLQDETTHNVSNVDILLFIDKLTPPLAQLNDLANFNYHISQINKLCALKGIVSGEAKFQILLNTLHTKIEDPVSIFSKPHKNQATLMYWLVSY